MSRIMPCSEELKDRHLDMMLQMAYKYENELMSRQLLDELDAAGMEYSEADARAAFRLFLQKYEQQQAQQKRKARRARARHIISRTAEVAACVVLIMAIAAPFAIAKVDAIRVKVLELLIEVKDDHTELSFVENEDAAFEVPTEWDGLYYPSYIPVGYKLYDVGKITDYAGYIDENDNVIFFNEYNISARVDINSENAEISHAYVNGADALVIQSNVEKLIIIAWAFEDKYFVIESQTTLDESLKMARSVRRIPENLG